jgi:hypothetical protein
MKNDLDTHDITRIIAQARKHRSDATGELIVSGTRTALRWLIRRGDRLLHAFLMSPVKTR